MCKILLYGIFLQAKKLHVNSKREARILAYKESKKYAQSTETTSIQNSKTVNDRRSSDIYAILQLGSHLVKNRQKENINPTMLLANT